MQGAVFGPRCSVILKKPGNPILSNRSKSATLSQAQAKLSFYCCSHQPRQHKSSPRSSNYPASDISCSTQSNCVQDFNAITAAFAEPETATAPIWWETGGGRWWHLSVPKPHVTHASAASAGAARSGNAGPAEQDRSCCHGYLFFSLLTPRAQENCAIIQYFGWEEREREMDAEREKQCT